jgi:hypothetical protein
MAPQACPPDRTQRVVAIDENGTAELQLRFERSGG